MATLTYEILGNRTDPKLSILILHGLGDSMEGWKPVASELRLPEVQFIFVNAPDEYYMGYSWFPIPGISDPYVDENDFRSGLESSRELLDEFIGYLENQYDIAADKLVLMGFSQGCCMVMDAALQSSRHFAGIIGISGKIGIIDEYPDAFSEHAAQQNILMTHGYSDDVLPYAHTKMEVERLQALGIPLQFESYEKAHSVDPYEELPLIRQRLQEWYA